MNDDYRGGDDPRNRMTEEEQEKAIADTGGPHDESTIEEISFSDFVDLSDPEEMDALAEEYGPESLASLVDEEGEEMAKYARDEDVLDDFIERQQVGEGTDQLMTELRDHTGQSPQTSADDVDAAWTDDFQSGEESVGASVATPEQNVMAELGEAVGLEYNDFEELNTEDKIDARDENRWELSAESVDAEEEDVEEDKEDDESALADTDIYENDET
jgi:hypothetical protein